MATTQQSASSTLKKGATVGAYRIERKESLENLQGQYYELVHEKTGARHIHIEVADDNNTFGVLFPTVPTDSTGIAHILEHVVLAGSKRFPVRDPFFSMIPRSLKTFMNALTSTDWTMYPFSSRNEKDFYNLLSVYLDACFFPLITEEAFSQEGHRFEFEELEDPDSGLRFKGVVFNEMKGAMASPVSVIQKALGKAVYPDLTYANNSGGDPADIPNLTHKQLTDFHAKHYHPSNAFFFTYGNLPLADILAQIEEQALSKFDRLDIDVSVPDQKRFTEPVVFETTYPLSKEEDPNRKSQVLVAWLTNHVGDSFEVLTLKVLQEVLLGNAASPVRKALIDSGLGDALADLTGFHSDYREALFAVGLKGTNATDADKVQSIVLDTLESIIKEGVDPSMVDAAIHQLEIEAREVSNAAYPYALKVFFTLSGAYIYGGDTYKSLQFDEDVAQLQEQRKSGSFFEDVIRRTFLDNTHRATVIVKPDQELEQKQIDTELARLAKIEAKLTSEDKSQIIERTKALKTSQDTKQDLSVLPTLELSDVPMTFEQVPNKIEQIGGASVGFFPQPTNGLTYIDVRGDFSGLTDRLKDLLPLFSYAVPKMGAAGGDYVKMAGRIDSYTGGITAGAGARPVAGSDDFRQSFALSGKALTRNNTQFVGILKDFLSAVEFDPKRLREVIAELRIQKEAMVVQAGMMYSMMLAASSLSAVANLEERLSGLTQLARLKEIAQLTEDQLSPVIEDLNAIKDYLFRNASLNICVTSEEKSFGEIRSLIEDALSALPDTPAEAAAAPAPVLERKDQARTTSVPVAFNAKVYPTVGFTHEDAPALMVLGNFMRATYLHREIREKGGAYGSHASSDAEKGLFAFWSYRDPNIVRTFSVFDSAVQEVIKGDIDADDLKEAVLTTCGSVDPLESPDIKGRRRYFDELAGYTLELREKFKKGLLSVTEADLRRVAEKYLSNGGACLATISSADKVAEANVEMGDIFEVSAI